MGEIYHFTRLGHYYQLLFTLLIAICLLTFASIDYNFENHWQSISEVVFAVGLSILIIGIFKFRTICIDRKYKTPVLKKCERDLTIGCFGMLFFAIIPYIVICFGKFPFAATVFVYFAFNITSAIVYYTFIWRIENLCHLEHGTPQIAIVGVIYLIIAFITLLLVSMFHSQIGAIVLMVVLSYSSVVMSTLITLSTVLMGDRIELAKSCEANCNEKINNQKKSKTRENAEATPQPTVLKCEICMIQCIENEIPGIVTSCGHRICQRCIEQSPFDQNQENAFCPFCHEVYDLNGEENLV
ncbi:Protein CBG19935 [Caenorhabditis briggsae]|uniref:Protein CBG19935 n=2 Tax=Caenorhabditis briggsae TaxID=6238 RepID=A8XWS0_CAEBR|nr:Protein CBG19935 [Caenorhabditis briggsae]ULT94400.1 hypothetical protein L3Y34_003700 [Caenorhabditis briggsae]CAP37089.1 Protein CBG19935 [Caenorhabditis briggsae]